MPVEPTICPECGGDSWTSEFGCMDCGYGRKKVVARHPAVVPAVVFFALVGLGLCAFAAFGISARPGAWLNVLLIVLGGATSMIGTLQMQHPTSLSVSDSQGTDAFGQTQWGPPRQPTAEEGIRNGAVFFVFGLGLVALGVFFGAITGAG